MNISIYLQINISEFTLQTTKEMWTAGVLLHPAWQKMVNSQALHPGWFYMSQTRVASSTHHGKKQSSHCRPLLWEEVESLTSQLLVFCLWITHEPTGNGTSLKEVWGLSSVATETVIFMQLVHLVELELYFGFKTSDGIGMGLGHCFTISQNGTSKRGLALSPQLLSLISCCSLPPIIPCVQDAMGNPIGMLIWVNTNLSLLRGWLTWTSLQSSSLYGLENTCANVCKTGVVWELK